MKNKETMKNNRDIQFFYNIVGLCETDKKLLGFGFNREKIKPFREKIDINLVTKIAEDKEIKLNQIFFKISYRNSRLSEPASLLVRIRNAFAHCQIIYNDKDKSYTMRDYNSKTPTMAARVKRKLLIDFISAILSSRTIE